MCFNCKFGGDFASYILSFAYAKLNYNNALLLLTLPRYALNFYKRKC